MSRSFSAEVPALYQEHLAHLTESAISLDVIRERGYRTATTAKELEDLKYNKAQRRVPGILIPLHAPDGSDAGVIYRPDNPRRNPKDKAIKYEGVPFSRLRLDVPKRCRQTREDPSVECWITEGAKKADALASHGVFAINLTGVWGFKGKNEFGATTFLADFDLIAWQDRVVYVCFDSDVTVKTPVRLALERLEAHLHRKGARVKIVLLPSKLKNKKVDKVGVDDYLADGQTIDDLRGLVVAGYLGRSEDEQIVVDNTVYMIHEGTFCLVRYKDGVRKLAPLCNFTARIQDEVILDDGLEETRHFSIQGSQNGRELPTIEVAAAQFPGLGWITDKWGSRAIVYAGSSTKDHLRTMIQLSSNQNGRNPRRVFCHTGWREIDGERLFLTASGAVGREGVEVSLSGPLARYKLPSSPDGVDPLEAMQASLRFLDIGDSAVQAVLWASMYLSPLCEVLEPAFTVWLCGHTGSFKSVLAGLALCHFGEFSATCLPASWRDTGNRLEWAMAMLKDLPLVIDDWHPAPTLSAARELEAKAEIVIRGQGNRAGRGRLRADASPREKYTPRGLVISTGEQIPYGESGASRLLVVDIERDHVKLDCLTRAQEEEARLYPHAMAGFIRWLREDWHIVEPFVRKRWADLRTQATQEGIHLRLPGAVGWLACGMELALRYAQEIGAIDANEADERFGRAWDSFLSLATRQGWRVDEERPAKRFLDVFSTLLTQQKIVLISRQQYEPMPDQVRTATFVGWKDDKYFYLLPQAIHGAVYDYSVKSGQPFTFKAPSVWADLGRLDLLASSEPGRNQGVVWVGSGRGDGSSKRVVRLKRTAVELGAPGESEEPDESGESDGLEASESQGAMRGV